MISYQKAFTKRIFFLITIIIIILLTQIGASAAPISFPSTGQQLAADSIVEGKYLFRLHTGNDLTATRVVVPGLFAYSVVQSGNRVPSDPEVVGQYALARNRNSIGILAHNNLAGSSFYALDTGYEVQVTMSDGSVAYYVISNVFRFQATDPNNFSRPFIDLNTGQQLSTRQIFDLAFLSGGVTFQTCIYRDGIGTWGLLFIQAIPGRGWRSVPIVINAVDETSIESLTPRDNRLLRIQ